jgi:beta-lactamase regulating signal transducer with metallopeptidase domain
MIAVGRHLLDSTAFALLVGVVCWCMRRRGAATRHTLWMIAVMKFAVPTALFFWAGERLRGLFPPAPAPTVLPAVLSRWAIYPAVSDASTSVPNTSFHPLVLFWLTGAALALGLWLPKLRTSWNSSESAEDFEQRAFVRLKELVGVGKHVQLRFCGALAEPLLAGFLNPVVMIPSGLVRQLSPAELDSVILHELSHAKRRDNWTAAFAHAITCVFWFYPLLWWMEKRLHQERELACDEMVIRSGAAVDDYVAGILKVCEFRLNEDVAGISAVSGSNLKNRMEVVMSLSSQGPLPHIPKALVAILAAGIVSLPLGIGLVTASIPRVAYASSQNAQDGQAKSQEPIACTFADVGYPEGTVIKEGDGPEQMCARVLAEDAKHPFGPPTYFAEWIRTSEAIRQRSAAVVRLAPPPPAAPFFCSPKPPTGGGLCTCEGGGQFSSGGRVNSAKSPFQLRCDHGKWVQTTTPNVQRE